MAIILGVLNSTVFRYVGKTSDSFPSNTKVLSFLNILLTLTFAIAQLQVSPLSIPSFEKTSSATLNLSYSYSIIFFLLTSEFWSVNKYLFIIYTMPLHLRYFFTLYIYPSQNCSAVPVAGIVVVIFAVVVVIVIAVAITTINEIMK